MARKSKQPKADKPLKEKFVTIGEYAVHRKVTTTRVYALIRSGRIPMERINGQQMVPIEKADMLLDATSRAPKGGVELDSLGDDLSPETYAGNRAKREKFEAELKRLSYEQKAGKLIEREHIEKIAFEVARRTRDNLLSIPDRIAADIAAETDPQKVHFMMTEALLAALNHGLSEPLKGAEKSLTDANAGVEEPTPEPEEDALGADDV